MFFIPFIRPLGAGPANAPGLALLCPCCPEVVILPLPGPLPQLPVPPFVLLPHPIVPLLFPVYLYSLSPSLLQLCPPSLLLTPCDPLAFCARVALGS